MPVSQRIWERRPRMRSSLWESSSSRASSSPLTRSTSWGVIKVLLQALAAEELQELVQGCFRRGAGVEESDARSKRGARGFLDRFPAEHPSLEEHIQLGEVAGHSKQQVLPWHERCRTFEEGS